MEVFNKVVIKIYCKACHGIKYIKSYNYCGCINSSERFIKKKIGLKIDDNYENNNRFKNNNFCITYNNNSHNNDYNRLNNNIHTNSYNNYSNNYNSNNDKSFNNKSYNNESYNSSISKNNNIIINEVSSHNQQNQTHLRGLVNIASTCYMNSILQCFSHIPRLYKYFQKQEISNIADNLYSENLLYPVLREVLVELWNSSNNSPYAPTKFKEKLGKMNPLFEGAYPNDAKDLLTFILIQLHEELNHPNNSNMNDNNIDINNIEIQKNKDLMFKYFSIISDLFFGIIYTKSFCISCKTTIYNYQLFNFLIFPLQKVLEYKMKLNNFQNNFNNTVSIYDCFDYSQSPSYLNEYYCNFCKCSKGCNYTTYLSVLPNIIIIIINRGKGIEYNINLSFDENIVLKKYVEFLNDECMYELFGVVTHYGDSSQSGHFVARCISPVDEMWYLYNDSIIQKIGYFNKEEFYSGHPYILFYRKVNFK